MGPGAALAPAAALTPAELAQFRAQGFLALGSSCAPDELQQLRALLVDLFERDAGYDEGNRFDMLTGDLDGAAAVQPQLLGPGLYAPQLLLTRHFERMLAVARQLIGPQACFNFDHAIIKRAGTNAATPWHQDEAHHRDPLVRFEQLSCWMPLQDVDEANGCMCYLPGTHHGPLLPHRPLQGDDRIHAMECLPGAFDAAAAVAVPVRAGTCIVHAGLTLHAALPNRSAVDRLAYVLAFRGPPLARAAGAAGWQLDPLRSADADRHRRWRRHGGLFVLWLRLARRVLLHDRHRLAQRLTRAVRQVTAVALAAPQAVAQALRGWRRR